LRLEETKDASEILRPAPFVFALVSVPAHSGLPSHLLQTLDLWLHLWDVPTSMPTLFCSSSFASTTTATETSTRRAASDTSASIVSLDPSTLAEDDYVDLDDHLLGRVEPGRVWLRVHRTAAPEEIGPVVLPQELTRHLRTGWTLCCSLGRLRGRWRFVELSEIHPRG